MVIMRGLYATPPESLGKITNEWLSKKIVLVEFVNYLKLRANGKATVLDDLTSFESVVAIFKRV